MVGETPGGSWVVMETSSLSGVTCHLVLKNNGVKVETPSSVGQFGSGGGGHDMQGRFSTWNIKTSNSALHSDLHSDLHSAEGRRFEKEIY